jgi:N-methylhydantoinase B/oxoprolinase/acetone carboxylase alpha subunit
VVRDIQFLGRTQVTVLSDRRRLPPPGAAGGAPGRPGRNRVRRANGTLREMPGKFSVWLDTGDVLSIETPGGGGWGRDRR